MRRPPLPTAVALVGTGVAAVYLVAYGVQQATASLSNNDFRAYFAAALVGLRQGWERIYDFPLQQAAAASIDTSWQPFANPPPLAWLVAPFTLLPFWAAYLAWEVLVVAALLLAWRLAAPGAGWTKLAHLTAALSLIAVVLALWLGQACVLVAAAVAVAWWLLRRGRDVEAGLVLTVILLKPQDAFLVPIALLVAGRVRAFAGWALAAGLVAAIAALTLGAHGLQEMLRDLAALEGVALNHRYAVSGTLGQAPWVLGLQALLGLGALYAAWRRRASVEMVICAGLLGSFLLTPHLSLQDFTVLIVAAWLMLRTAPPLWFRFFLLTGYALAVFAIPFGGAPLLVVEVAWLAALAAGLQNHQDRRPQQDDP